MKDNKITITLEQIREMPDNSVTDAETIRQIALFGIANAENVAIDFIYRKIKSGYEVAGLYPFVVNILNVNPE